MRQLQADATLLGVTFIWGVTFVVVQNALASIGPYYFLAVRFGLAFLFLALIAWRHWRTTTWREITSGFLVGLFLFGGYAFQTMGLQYTSAANAGFITGLSVVLVPLFSALAAHRWPEPVAGLSAALACAGLALLSLGQGLTLNWGDILVFACAICLALHIIAVGHFAPSSRPLVFAAIQIATVATISSLIAPRLETWPGTFTGPVWIALAVTAIPATSGALLIQTWAQQFTSPTHTAIIFTAEPVFAALTAYLWAGQALGIKQLLGCALILGGMLLAELKPSQARPSPGCPQSQAQTKLRRPTASK